jgi:hypothetical protein
MLTENDHIDCGLDQENQHEKRDEDGDVTEGRRNCLLQNAYAWDQVREQEDDIGALYDGVNC